MVSSINSKNDYRNVVIKITDFLKPYYDEGSNRILLKGGKYDAADGFSQMMWAVAPFIKGGGKNSYIEDLYRLGTINGTDPNSKGYWNIGDNIHKNLNMAAPIACGLLINSDKILYLFRQNERQNIVNWLCRINECSYALNEEQSAVILVNSALKLLGRPYNKLKLNAAFNTIENMYLGNGWYGLNGVKNYRATTVIQFNSLIYAKTMVEYDTLKCSVYIHRAIRFLDELCKNNILSRKSGDIALLGFCAAYLYTDIEADDVNIASVIDFAKNSMNYYSKLLRKIITEVSENDADYDGNAHDFVTWYMKTFLVLALPQEHKFWLAG